MLTKCKPAKIKNSMDMHVHPMDDSMDMNLSKFQKIIKDRRAWWAAVHGVTKSGTQFSKQTTKTMTKKRTWNLKVWKILSLSTLQKIRKHAVELIWKELLDNFATVIKCVTHGFNQASWQKLGLEMSYPEKVCRGPACQWLEPFQTAQETGWWVLRILYQQKCGQSGLKRTEEGQDEIRMTVELMALP